MGLGQLKTRQRKAAEPAAAAAAAMPPEPSGWRTMPDGRRERRISSMGEFQSFLKGRML